MNLNIPTVDSVTSGMVKNRMTRVTYKKLVVPCRMRSLYWKFFGFPANDDKTIITKDVIVCIVCRTQMIYNRNTSNLRVHLRCHHKDIYSKINPTVGVEPAPSNSVVIVDSSKDALCDDEYANLNTRVDDVDPSIRDIGDDTVVVSEEGNDVDLSNINIAMSNDDALMVPESTELNEAIVDFLIADLVSPDIVHGNGFQRLLSTAANKPINILHEGKISGEVLPTLYQNSEHTLKDAVLNDGITNMSISVEEFSTSDNNTYVSFYAHYLKSGQFDMETIVLQTVCSTDIHDMTTWERTIDNIFRDWRINLEAVSATVLSIKSPELRDALKALNPNFTLLPCFLHTLQVLCGENLFRLETSDKILACCRELVKWIIEERIEPDTVYEERDDDDELDELDEMLPFGFDQPDQWLTTYSMLVGVHRRRENILANDPNGARCHFVGKDWIHLEELITFLKPFKAIVLMILEEKSPLISLLHPVKQKVEDSLRLNMQVSSFLMDLRSLTSNALSNTYTEYSEASKFMQISTILDPRFKTFNHDETQDRFQEVDSLLTQLVEEEGLCDGTTYTASSSTTSDASSSKKRARLSGINSLLGDIQVQQRPVSPTDKLKKELSYYETSNEAMLEECSLKWWKNIQNRCPNLIRLAHKYLCVPAAITHSSKNILSYVRFHNKRQQLSWDTVNELLFLHLNNKR